MPAGQFLCGVLEHAAAAAGEPDVSAELEVPGGDLLAEAGAAAGDKDALTLEKVFLEHARSWRGARILSRHLLLCGRVRSFAEAERPVLLGHLDQVDPRVLAAQAQGGEGV